MDYSRVLEVKSIRPVDLLIDSQNPRLVQPNVGQREALRSLAERQGKKLSTLAADIVKYGVNPSDLMIVMPAKDSRKRYKVLEGNRRLTAIRALENPESFAGSIPTTTLNLLRRLSRQYEDAPVEEINCLVVKKRTEAHHWIELRHTGENKGAGIVSWGSEEAGRFRSRDGHIPPHMQALDMLEQREDLTPEYRRKIPTTSFKRLLDTPEVREKLGIEIDGGVLRYLAPENKVSKALLYIAQDLATGRTKVADIYHRNQRVEYAESLPSSIVVKPTHKAKAASPTRQTRKKKRTRRKQRTSLIPEDCVLGVTDSRAQQIEEELRGLHLETYPNAIAVLFRVFIELSVDAYVEANGISPKNEKLREKMRTVVDDLVSSGQLTKDQASPVRKALQKNSWLAPSLDLMNDYVHNRSVYPAPGDLRAHWSSLQAFFTAIWSV